MGYNLIKIQWYAYKCLKITLFCSVFTTHIMKACIIIDMLEVYLQINNLQSSYSYYS